jgi:hypothetical protein
MTTEEFEFKSAIEKIFAELDREREQMKRDQEEFERSKVRTGAMLEQLLAQLKAA